jgi:hypothetical protein
MNIAIQRVQTREFLGESPEDWVRDPHEAMAFPDTRTAISYCRVHCLQNVRLVVFFRDRKVSFLLYVPGSTTPQPAGINRIVPA